MNLLILVFDLDDRAVAFSVPRPNLWYEISAHETMGDSLSRTTYWIIHSRKRPTSRSQCPVTLQSKDVNAATLRERKCMWLENGKRVVIGFRAFSRKKERCSWMCVGSDRVLSAGARNVA